MNDAPLVQRIPLAAQPVMPWQNGGGVTRQVAIDPDGATLATGFRWRVSFANVAQSGPFSRMPGIDRSLWLVRGDGMRIRFHDREVTLDRPLQRVDFRGEDDANATLLGGACEDCNVMTRRGKVRADAEWLELEAGRTSQISGVGTKLLVAVEGCVEVMAPRIELAAGDAARWDADSAMRFCATVRSRVLCIRLAAFARD